MKLKIKTIKKILIYKNSKNIISSIITMEERTNIDFTVRNYLNINVIMPWNPIIRPLIGGGEYKPEFIIEYKGYEYIF